MNENFFHVTIIIISYFYQIVNKYDLHLLVFSERKFKKSSLPTSFSEQVIL